MELKSFGEIIYYTEEMKSGLVDLIRNRIIVSRRMNPASYWHGRYEDPLTDDEVNQSKLLCDYITHIHRNESGVGYTIGYVAWIDSPFQISHKINREYHAWNKPESGYSKEQIDVYHYINNYYNAYLRDLKIDEVLG